jgi:divalent metal cation (Fe/Co/Zn/Cd) transporter
VLAGAAALQAVIFVTSVSVALLADMIHNFGDALTAVPLGIAFILGSDRAEKGAGLFVVLAIFTSAAVALYAPSSFGSDSNEPTPSSASPSPW